MDGIDFSRMNERSFERLTRALCFKVFGPGGTVFSSGPDGGRDFTFDGEIRGYEPRKWKGYLVVQAKFKERLSGGEKDVSWLLDQLEAEHQALESAGRRPEYYIVATNVSLSGADGRGRGGALRTGGVSKTSTLLQGWKATLGLKDFDLWPADKLADLLASEPEIRRTYAAWITPGDVLTQALTNLQGKSQDLTNAVRRAIKNSLRRDQLARLKDAGSVADADIRTSQVFIDLPVAASGIEEWELESGPPPGVVRLIVERARERLDPAHMAEQAEQDRTQGNACRNKIVLFGGPGQGKSTASLFITQIFRAASLESDPGLKLDENIRELVPEILRRAEQEGISSAVPRRFPIHVALPRFADAISATRAEGRQPPSLLNYIATELSKTSEQPILLDDLRRWLAAYPWLLVLDGLDEVPPSGERAAVLDALANLTTEVTDVNADVLFLVTTRPQGYNGDLKEGVWQHWRLADLPSERALAYAKALALARYPNDPERCSDIEARMRDAASKPTTSRLMVSPLQVTIIQLIVDTGGSIPAARWLLFHEYFEVLKKREKAKGGATQKILERNMAYVGPIHQRVGLILQIDSELAGGAGAALEHGRFKALLKAYLESEGFEGQRLTAQVDELMEVALHRLVLLSTREEGRISFDVRSLQEYMAASALTSGDPLHIDARLLHIAGKSHWRHVFLIAASRCFADDGFHHRRSAVVSIPRQLECGVDGVDSLVRNGAKLALEMFLDGIGAEHPLFRRQLAAHALEMLSLGTVGGDDRLLHLLEPDTHQTVFDTIKSHVNHGATAAALAAWRLLLKLGKRGVPEAVELAEHVWPSDDPVWATRILEVSELSLGSDKLAEYAEDALVNVSPGRSQSATAVLFRVDREGQKHNEHPRLANLRRLNLPLLLEASEFRARLLPTGKRAPDPISLIAVSTDSTSDVAFLAARRFQTPEWKAVSAAARFQAAPSPERLAEAVEIGLSIDKLESAQVLLQAAAWPLAAILGSVSDRAEAKSLPDRIRAGEFGDASAWKAAEARWRKHGITEEDLAFAEAGAWFGHEVDRVGSPGIGRMSVTNEAPGALITALKAARLCRQVSKGPLKRHLVRLASFACVGAKTGATFSLGEANELVDALRQVTDVSYWGDMLALFPKEFWHDDALVEKLEGIASAAIFVSGRRHRLPSAELVDAYGRNSARRALLFLIAHAAAAGDDSQLAKLDKSAFHGEKADSPAIQAAVTTLRILSGRFDGVDATEMAATIKEGQRPAVERLLYSVTRNDNISVSALADIAKAIVPSNYRLANAFHEAICRRLDARQARFNEGARWFELHLPRDALAAISS